MSEAPNRLSLWLGGARSGKSRLAQNHAEALDGELFFLATGEPGDEEMAARIARHRADRGRRWRTVEAPLDLPEVVRREARAGRVLLIDCLTLWVSNLMLQKADIGSRTRDLVDALSLKLSHTILVSNEVGLGIVPDNELARRFRDEAGRLNQAVARAADDVFLVAAGLALRMK